MKNTKNTSPRVGGAEMAHSGVLREVSARMSEQVDRWGDPDHPDGTSPGLDIIEDIGHYPAAGNAELVACARARTDALSNVEGRVTYAHILTEEWAKTMACEDPGELREQLLDVAAVASSWVTKIDRDSLENGGAQ